MVIFPVMKISQLLFSSKKPGKQRLQSSLRVSLRWMGMVMGCLSGVMADSYTTGPYLNGRYEYDAYNLKKMDPQLTGWPISDAARAYCNTGQSLRRPGMEPGGEGQKMVYLPTTPSAQGGDWWLAYHGNLVSMLDKYRNDHGSKVDILLVGDSITEQWCGSVALGTYDSARKLQPFNAAWTNKFGAYTAINLGIGGDRTQSVLWRLDHDGVKGLDPRLIVLGIGHNNMFFTGPNKTADGGNTGTDAAARGILCCIQNLLEKFPNSHILVVKILPCFNKTADFYIQAKAINLALDKLNLGSDPRVHMMPDMWNDWIGSDGNPKPELFLTGTGEPVHPSQVLGYSLYAEKLYPVVTNLLNTNNFLYFTNSAASVMEDQGQVKVLVQRLGGTETRATVQYSTRNGTALSGTDYVSKTGTLVWEIGDASDKSIIIPIKDNAVSNASKTFFVSLNSPAGAKLGTPSEITVSILDDEQAGSFVFSSLNNSYVKENGGSVTFAVSRVGGKKGAASIRCSIKAGTALPGSEYENKSEVLLWNDGEMGEKFFTVSLLDDAVVESQKTFTLTLSDAVGASLGTSPEAPITILDDDTPSFTVYDEKIGSGWVTNGWKSTMDAASSVNPKNGVRCSAITLTASGGARGYLARSNFDTTPYSSVSFWLNPGPNAGQKLELRAYYGTTIPAGYVIDLSTATPNTWRYYTIPLSSIGAAEMTNLSALRFVDQGGKSINKTFYIDSFIFDVKQKQIAVGLASVQTTAVSGIQQTEATFGGNVTNEGSTRVKERGVCWSVFPNPTISDQKIANGSGLGSWTNMTEGLSPETTYYVRAYAINEGGVAYGASQRFVTPGIRGLVETFASWISSQGYSGTNALAASDPDGDGVNNLLEYGLSLDPKNRALKGIPSSDLNGNNFTLSYRKDPSKTDLTYRVEWSTDLKTWSTVGVTDQVVSSKEGVETHEASVATQNDTKKFLRLVVEKP